MNIWILILIFCILIETLTISLVTIWFMPGIVIAMIMDYYHIGYIWQIMTVLISSLFFICLLRPIVMRTMRHEKTNLDRLIGENAKVIRKFNDGIGIVIINGNEWRAECKEDTPPVNSYVRVKAIKGVTLIVERR